MFFLSIACLRLGITCNARLEYKMILASRWMIIHSRMRSHEKDVACMNPANVQVSGDQQGRDGTLETNRKISTSDCGTIKITKINYSVSTKRQPGQNHRFCAKE